MKIAVLGPKGTYSDIAKDKLLRINNLSMETEYYPSIIKTIESLDKNDYALIPFENSLDGFLMEALDRIVKDNLYISYQIKLPIDFAFVANRANINEIKNVYCQFKACGQCEDFILSQKFDIIKTESNIWSLELLKKQNEPFGAIVPMHVLEHESFPLSIPHIADSKNNETRFFLISKEKRNNNQNGKIVASVLFSSIVDKPGILFQILKSFHDRSINLNSILSRPSKIHLGSYSFYIECSIDENELDSFNDLVKEFETNDNVKITILGIYNSII